MTEQYDPAKSLQTEVDRFKATNQFTPMLVTNFYAQAACVLTRLREAEAEREEAITNFTQQQKSFLELTVENHGLKAEIATVKAEHAALRSLVLNCQEDLAHWIVPDSGVTDHEVLNQLLSRLDGPQAREALSALPKGWDK